MNKITYPEFSQRLDAALARLADPAAKRTDNKETGLFAWLQIDLKFCHGQLAMWRHPTEKGYRRPSVAFSWSDRLGPGLDSVRAGIVDYQRVLDALEFLKQELGDCIVEMP